MLMSTRPNAEYEIMSIFGPSIYLCKSFKQQIRVLKRLFEDINAGYQGFMELMNG